MQVGGVPEDLQLAADLGRGRVGEVERVERVGPAERHHVAAVAEEAQVDRSFIYSQTDLAEEIKRLRDETTGPLKPRPQRERASDASLHVRLAAAQQANAEQRNEIKQLHDENRALREEISRLRGERWENVA